MHFLIVLKTTQDNFGTQDPVHCIQVGVNIMTYSGGADAKREIMLQKPLLVVWRSQGQLCNSGGCNYLDLQKTFIKIPLKSFSRTKVPWDERKGLHKTDWLTKGKSKWVIVTKERSHQWRPHRGPILKLMPFSVFINDYEYQSGKVLNHSQKEKWGLTKRSCRRTSQHCTIKCQMKFNKDKWEVMPRKKNLTL